MIDDIVVLPSRLNQFRRDMRISSVRVEASPMSRIPRDFGYEEPRDDIWFETGTTQPGRTGKDAWFRFKIVERTRTGICEYFCLTDTPINFLKPNLKAVIRCLWVTVTDLRTLRVRKYVLWANVFELTHSPAEDNTNDAPVESVIANEVRDFANMYGCPELAAEVAAYPNYRDVLISEVHYDPLSGIDKLALLGANMRAYNEIQELNPYYNGCDIFDILRGVDLPKIWTDTSPLMGCHVLRYVQYGSIQLKDIIHLISPYFKVHAFQRSFNERKLHALTEIDIPQDDPRNLFTIIKYVERLPYSEFELRFERGKQGTCKLFNPYDPASPHEDNRLSDQASVVSIVLSAIKAEIAKGFPNYSVVTLARSWAEEIYITVVNTDGKVERYYFDMSFASICSRSLIRDYDGSMTCF